MENRPVLKKVRRPINRMPVQSSPIAETDGAAAARDVSNNDSPTVSAPKFQSNSVNLPSVNNVTANQYNNQSSAYEPEEPQFIEDEYSDAYFEGEKQGVSMAILAVAVILSLLVGLLIGKFFFTETQTTHNGLQGVVINSEVPRGRARCGVSDKNQGCVLYIMNPQRQNVRAKDFYDMAAQVTGRQRYMIETGNMRYANTEIRPGDIAQLNIPPL